jgi:hypothetical protein
MTPVKRVSPRAKLSADERRAIAEAEAQEGEKNLDTQGATLSGAQESNVVPAQLPENRAGQLSDVPDNQKAHEPNLENTSASAGETVNTSTSQKDETLMIEQIESFTPEQVELSTTHNPKRADILVTSGPAISNVASVTDEVVSNSPTQIGEQQTSETVDMQELQNAQMVTMLSTEQLNELAMRLIQLSADQPGRLPAKKDREQQAIYLPPDLKRVLNLLRSLEGREMSEIMEDGLKLYLEQSSYRDRLKMLLDSSEKE